MISNPISKFDPPTSFQRKQPWQEIPPAGNCKITRLCTTDKRQIEQWPVEEWTSRMVSPALSIVCWYCCRYCFLNYDSPPGIDEPVDTICNYFGRAWRHDSNVISQQGVEQRYIRMVKFTTLKRKRAIWINYLLFCDLLRRIVKFSCYTL